MQSFDKLFHYVALQDRHSSQTKQTQNLRFLKTVDFRFLFNRDNCKYLSLDAKAYGVSTDGSLEYVQGTIIA